MELFLQSCGIPECHLANRRFLPYVFLEVFCVCESEMRISWQTSAFIFEYNYILLFH